MSTTIHSEPGAPTQTDMHVTRHMLACAIVASAWRDALAPVRSRVTVQGRAYSNIATTRDVARDCTEDGADWAAVRATLLDPDRRVLPTHTVAQVAGRDWTALQGRIERRLDEVSSVPVATLATWGALTVPHWWGMPGYPERAAAIVATGNITRWCGPRKELGTALLHEPLTLPLTVWAQFIAISTTLDQPGRTRRRKQP